MKRRTLCFAGGGLIAALLLFAALVIAVAYGWQREWLREKVEARLAAALQLPVSIGAIEGPLHRDVSLRALRIGEPSAPLLELDALRVQLGTLQLLGTPTLLVSRLELRRPQLHLRRGIDGNWPWQTRTGGDAAPFEAWPLALAVDSFVLEAGVVEVADGEKDLLYLEIAGSLDDSQLGPELAVGKLRSSFVLRGPTAGADSAIAGSLAASYGAGRFESVALQAEGPGFDAQARGSGTLDAIEQAVLSVRIDSLDAFDDLLLGDQLAISGSVSLSANLRGALRWPIGSVVIDAADIRAADFELGALRLAVASEQPGTLRVDELRVDGGILEVSAAPGARIFADETRFALRGLELRGNGGKSVLKLDFESSPLWPRGLDALLRDPATRVTVEARAWPLGALAPLWHFVGVEASGLLDANLALTGAEPEPQLHGSLQLRSGELRVSDAEAHGLQLDVEVDGTPLVPRAKLAATAEAIRWADQQLGALRLALESSDGRTAVIEELALRGGVLSLRVGSGSRLRLEGAGLAFEDFDLMLEDQQLQISGWVSESAAAGLRLEFASLDAARLARLATALSGSAAAPEIAGQLSGRLAWDGPLADPTLTGQLQWTDARLGELMFDRIEAGVGTRSALVRIDSRWTYQGRPALDAVASLPASRVLTEPAALLDDPRASLRMRADGFELASLARFLPAAVSGLAGSLTADLRATGGPFPANVSGQLAIERGAATLRALGGQKLSPITARASLAGEQIRLDAFQIGEPNARIQATGTLALSARRPRAIDLHLVFENYAIDAPGLVKGALDGPVDLTGTAQSPELRGRLELSGLRVQIPESDSVELKEIRVISADGGDTDSILSEDVLEAPLLDRLRLEVDVAVRRNSWARGRGAEVELQGDLEARKDPGLPLALGGSFQTVRGTYQIYGRRFRIDRGEALFDGGEEVDPVLDIRAEHKVRGVRIFALLEGRLSEPSLHFESDPELSETDIASYLILGRPAADASAGEQPALDAVAAQIAAGAALSEFERLFGGALPVDLLDVRMEGEGEASEVRAGVGKYVGDRLFLYYEHGFGDVAEDELRAEYELTPHWSVESNVSTGEEVGANLIFEFEN